MPLITKGVRDLDLYFIISYSCVDHAHLARYLFLLVSFLVIVLLARIPLYLEYLDQLLCERQLLHQVLLLVHSVLVQVVKGKGTVTRNYFGQLGNSVGVKGEGLV